MTALGVVAILAAAGLLGWRWFLSAHVADKAHQRAHELALKERAVKVEQAAIDKAIGEVASLKDRVRSLECRPR